MNIESKWLEDLLSLAKTHSFSRSAEERCVTQPAFSRRIKALEAALQCELVDRSGTPVQLTEQGALFAVTASNLINQLKDSVSYLQSYKQRTEVIDFAVSHTLSLSFFPSFLNSFQQDLANISTRQLVANVDDSIQALKNGISDFLIAFETPSLPTEQFQKLVLQTEYLIPVCKGDKHGAPLYSLNGEGKAPIPYLSYSKEVYFNRCVEGRLKKSNRHNILNQTFESSMADSLKAMAMQGLGLAWIPTFAISNELKQKSLIVCGDESWSIPLTICVYRCKRLLSDSAENLWNVLEQHWASK